MRDKIVVYGTDECRDTQRTRRQLESLGVAYDYVDVDRDRAANLQVTEWNGGRRVTPTVVLPESNVVTGTSRLAAPSNEELEERLRETGMR